MKEHHKRVINRLKEHLEKDDKNLALILCGSCATGKTREDSDIDIYIVVTDEEYEKVKEKKDYYYNKQELVDYEDGYIDGKIVNMQFLKDAVHSGSEPTRASFIQAYSVFSKIEGIDELIQQIAQYPEKDREKKLKVYYSYLLHTHYYAEQGIENNNVFLKMRYITDLVFFSARLVLAYNRILYPCEKSLFTAVEGAEKKPEGFIKQANHLLKNMDLETMNNFYNSVVDYFAHCQISEEERVGLILENEMSWFTHTPSIIDW